METSLSSSGISPPAGLVKVKAILSRSISAESERLWLLKGELGFGALSEEESEGVREKNVVGAVEDSG